MSFSIQLAGKVGDSLNAEVKRICESTAENNIEADTIKLIPDLVASASAGIGGVARVSASGSKSLQSGNWPGNVGLNILIESIGTFVEQ